MHFKHRKLIILIEILFLLLFFWWFETFTIKITKSEIQNEKIKNRITIVQLTDLHGAQFGEQNLKLIKKIEKQNPDIIVSTGDMYSAGDEKGKKVAFELLTKLAQKYSVYFVNGEHDNNKEFMEKLKENKVHVLDYKDEIVTIEETKLHIYGIDNVYYSPTFDLKNEFQQDSENYTILLAHIANQDKFEQFGIDLSICGDTHGGQVRLPWIGAIYTEGVWFPELLGEPIKGLYKRENSNLFISSGLGNYPIPLRTFNRPEIAVIRLVPKNNS